uniref:Uncharacterized protein n=1 Tax=Oryza brachyantha TaxID=4533 RepID=J3MXB9_ORYBR
MDFVVLVLSHNPHGFRAAGLLPKSNSVATSTTRWCTCQRLQSSVLVPSIRLFVYTYKIKFGFLILTLELI